MKWIGLAEKNPNRAGEVAPKIGADFVTQSHVELLKRPEVTAAIIATDEHLHVDPIMAAVERGMPMLIEKPLATDLAAIRARAQGDQGRQARRRGRLHPALPPPLAGGQGEMPHRRARRRHAGDLARLHEPAGRDRQLQAHRRSGDHLADGDLRHARARHLHVVPRRQDAGRMLRALDRQGAGPALPGHRRHRRHDHVLRRHRLSSQHFLGAAGDLAGRGLFARGRHRRHHRRAHHRRHPPRHRAGGVEAAVAKATTRTPRGWSISWAAIRPATWRSANCAGRWRTRR